MSEPVTYTLAELDEAIIRVLGKPVHILGPVTREKRLYEAASRAWITNRPEDHHTAILRAAYADLERTGAFQPRGEG